MINYSLKKNIFKEKYQIIDVQTEIVQLKKNFLLIKDGNMEPQSCHIKDFDIRISDYDYVYCTFNNDKIIQVELVEKFEHIKDIEHNKFSLNIKTKLSSFNGINDIDILLKTLQKYNIKAFSINDINNLNNIPKIFNKIKDTNLKFIPSLEIDIIDDLKENITFTKNNQSIFNNKLINDIDFFIVDLETNGINSYSNEIIEIGVVHMKNNYIVKNYQWFIYKKDLILKQSITDLTGITLKELKKLGKNPIQIAERFWSLIDNNNSILVSHSEFDLGFLNNFFKKYINKEIYQPHIDTWFLSQKTFLKSKSFSVSKLCIFLNIEQKGQAHRALDDAINTTKIFIKILAEIKVHKIKDLREYRKNKVFFQTYNFRTILFCKNKESLIKLNEILSIANCYYFKYNPRIPLSFILKNKKLFYIVSPYIKGEVSSLFEKGILKFFINKIKIYDFIEIIPESSMLQIINNKWFILQNKNSADKKKYNSKNIFDNKYIEDYYKILKSNNIKIIATDSSRYTFKEDYLAFNIIHSYHRIYDGIIDNCKLYIRRYKEFINEFPLLEKIFSKQEVNEILIKNSQIMVDNIKTNFELIKQNFFLIKNDKLINNFIEKVWLNANHKYKIMHPIIKKRIEDELNIIIKENFINCFNLGEKVAKFIHSKNEILGSRGSIGSSFIAYILNITEVNALPPHYKCPKCYYIEFIKDVNIKSGYDLIDKKCNKCNINMKGDGHNLNFNMFFGIKGNKIPDIDININSQLQKECHDIFLNQNKTIISYNELKNIKILKNATNLKIQDKNSLFFIKKFEEKYNVVINHDIEIKFINFLLKNSCITSGQHPGGIIFIPEEKNIFEYSPIMKNKDNFLLQYEWHDLDKILFKLDILGHDDPMVVSYLLKQSNININSIKFNDNDIISLFNSYDLIDENTIIDYEKSKIYKEFKSKILTGTLGIPEFGTNFCRRVLNILKPKNFNNLVQISGLTHGKNIWQNNSRNLIISRQKTIDDILCNRDDVFYFLLSKGLEKELAFNITEFIKKGKTYKDLKQWEIYEKILKKNNIDDIMISHLKKISYLFPKAHAIAYVINAFRIAYFKVYHPLLFYNSFLNRKLNDISEDMLRLPDKELLKEINKESRYTNYIDHLKKNRLKNVFSIILEMKYRNINILNIDLFKSDPFLFKVEDNNIRPPLCIIKGVGTKTLKIIQKTRTKNHNIKNYEEFKKKFKINEATIKLLIKYNVINLKQNKQSIFSFIKNKNK